MLFVNCFLITETYRKLSAFGIETSCDDTGCAVVDENGKILGESRFSQAQIHWE